MTIQISYLLILNKNFFDLIEYKTSLFLYKGKHKLVPNSIQKIFYSNEDSLHNTRQRDKLKKCTMG